MGWVDAPKVARLILPSLTREEVELLIAKASSTRRFWAKATERAMHHLGRYPANTSNHGWKNTSLDLMKLSGV